MQFSLDEILTWTILGAVFLGAAGLYGFLIIRQVKLLFAAMIRLRDKIDRSERH